MNFDHLTELRMSFGCQIAEAAVELATEAGEQGVPYNEVVGVAIATLLGMAASFAAKEGSEEDFIACARLVYREFAKHGLSGMTPVGNA